jgi:ADP-ribose pyrophosphatase
LSISPDAKSADAVVGAEVTIESRVDFRGRLLTVRTDRVRLADGTETNREVVEHRGAVAIVAIDEAGDVLLVRQYRKPAERALLEIPAGTLESGEDPSECANRELIEETGHRASRIERICGFYTAPGYCTEFLHVFVARDLTPAFAEADADERIQVARLPLRECIRLIRSGEICDAKSIVGLLAVESGWGLTE